MILGPKYKIARRLGAPVFEKTQTQKFAVSLAKKTQNKKRGGHSGGTTFGAQLLEKQKARFTYGISEKQFSKYAKETINKKYPNPEEKLAERLESRLDNTVWRVGFTSTRRGARQAVSHGHIRVNGKRVTIPSFMVSIGDKITIKEKSKASPLFASLKEQTKTKTPPSWIKFKSDILEGEVVGTPTSSRDERLFDLAAILEFYRQ